MAAENIGIVPARGGSKGITLKNLRPLNGIPLVAYGILSSLKAPSIDRTIVSTDHEAIAETALAFGAEVVLRPPEISGDDAPTEPAMQHVVETLEGRGLQIGHVALIQCTCPFRLAADIEKGFEVLRTGDCDAVMSVSPVPGHFHPYWLKQIDGEGHLVSLYREHDIANNILESRRYWRRQDLPGEYFWKNGALYITRCSSLMKLGHRYGTRCCPLVLDDRRLVNIDTERDLERAEELLRRGDVTLDFLD
jgi:CMP-N,N'-diacetyllegionaminic acid synthase